MRKQPSWLLRALGGLLLAAAIAPAAASQGRLISLSDEPGKWRPWSFTPFSPSDLRSLGAAAADAKAFETRLKQLADIFRASPVWNPPVGVDAMVSGSASTPLVPKMTPPMYQPLAGDLLMGSFEHLAADRGDGVRPEPFVGGETMLVQVKVNLLPGGGSGISLGDEGGAFLKEPVKTSDMGGFPVYGRDLLVITTNGRPLWTPVSRERYLTAFIAKRRREAAAAEVYIADQQKQLDAFLTPEATAARQAKYKAAIDKLASKGAAAVEHERRYWERDEADSLAALKRGASHDPKVSTPAAIVAGLKAAQDQLAAMSAADRGEPACFVNPSGPIEHGLVPAGTAGCARLVTENRRFFDAQLPRSVLQIVTVLQFGDLENIWKKGRPVAGTSGQGSTDLWTTYEVLRRTDWKKVADLLGR